MIPQGNKKEEDVETAKSSKHDSINANTFPFDTEVRSKKQSLIKHSSLKVMLLCILIYGALKNFFIDVFCNSNATSGCVATSVATPTNNDPCMGPIPKGVPPFKYRNDLGAILQQENKTTGVELGVQSGVFARTILSQWISCNEYHLVDLWAQQDNYSDIANVNQAQQNKNFERTMRNMAAWTNKMIVCQNYTSVCVERVPDEHFDFIYVDARHDFKGVYEDMVAWWPKLRMGGIMAGHDYVTQDDRPQQTGQDWTHNYDGTIDKTGTVVKGEVDKFATEVCRQLTISYREHAWNSWAMRK